jgi:hypothetical protein
MAPPFQTLREDVNLAEEGEVGGGINTVVLLSELTSSANFKRV